MHRRIIGAVAASLLLTPMALAQTSTSAGGSADVILRGGPIVTVNDRQPKAEAVAVRNGSILAVGDAHPSRASIGGALAGERTIHTSGDAAAALGGEPVADRR